MARVTHAIVVETHCDLGLIFAVRVLIARHWLFVGNIAFLAKRRLRSFPA